MTDAQREEQKLQWEIQQVAMAIDYFERAIEETFFVREAEEHRKTIQKLNNQLQELERKRDAIVAG